MKNIKKKTKSGQAADSGRRYIYAFLQQAGCTTDTQSSLDVDEQEDQELSDEHAGENPTQTTEKPPRYNEVSRKRKHDIESSLIEFMKAPMPCSTIAAVPETNNPDRAFFESILPSISCFTEDQKLEFRCEILNIIKRMRMSQINSQAQVNVPPQNCVYPSNSLYQASSNVGLSYTLCPTRNPFNYVTPTQSHQPSSQLTELRTHRSPPICQEQISSLEALFPSTSSSSSVNSLLYSNEDSLDIFRDGH